MVKLTGPGWGATKGAAVFALVLIVNGSVNVLVPGPFIVAVPFRPAAPWSRRTRFTRIVLPVLARLTQASSGPYDDEDPLGVTTTGGGGGGAAVAPPADAPEPSVTSGPQVLPPSL